MPNGHSTFTDGLGVNLKAELASIAALVGAIFVHETPAQVAPNQPEPLARQSLDDAWWTGPILAASASTLPRGHFLVEPYLYDSISYAHYDAQGERRNTADAHFYGSQTYVLYGLTDLISVGLIPRFGHLDVDRGADSDGIRIGDVSLQAQYRLAQFRPGIPTTSIVLQATLPTGDYDQLGERPSNGLGSGAYSATLGVYSQYFFWMPNGRILRTRLNLSQTFSDHATLEDVSVYGTEPGFRGRAEPGDAFTAILAGEYSVTRNWVIALDLQYDRRASTRVIGVTSTRAFDVVLPTSRRVSVAPALEYNFNSRIGIIFGALWVVDAENADASITPVVALNMVY